MSAATDTALPAAEARALFVVPEIAFNRPVPKVEAVMFAAERARAFDPGAPTGFIDLDQGAAIGCEGPATTPGLLARYLVLRPGEQFEAALPSGGDCFYVLRGTGHSQCQGERFDWGERDVFCLPGGVPAIHSAADGAILMVINDEPLLRFIRSQPDIESTEAVAPTLFRWSRTMEGLREVHGRNGEQLSAGKSVLFLTESAASRKVLTRTLLASVNSLEPGGDQRPHRHCSAALTLPIECDGVFSTVDGQRIDWIPDCLIVTPPNMVHSHHNHGPRMMLSLVVQDTGLHTELRTTNFAWTDQ